MHHSWVSSSHPERWWSLFCTGCIGSPALIAILYKAWDNLMSRKWAQHKFAWIVRSDPESVHVRKHHPLRIIVETIPESQLRDLEIWGAVFRNEEGNMRAAGEEDWGLQGTCISKTTAPSPTPERIAN